MKFVQKEFSATLEIKKSKFIAHIFPFNDPNNFKPILEKLKAQYPKARHFVYAYQYINQYNQIIQNSSDDGEPRNTSGKPSLKVLEGKGLINTAIIIIRYFGGIKLGTGGLVKAYSDAVNLVISVSTLEEYIKLEYRTLLLSYDKLNVIKYQLEKYNIKITNTKFDNKILLNLTSSKENFDTFSLHLPQELSLQYA